MEEMDVDFGKLSLKKEAKLLGIWCLILATITVTCSFFEIELIEGQDIWPGNALALLLDIVRLLIFISVMYVVSKKSWKKQSLKISKDRIYGTCVASGFKAKDFDYAATYISEVKKNKVRTFIARLWLAGFNSASITFKNGEKFRFGGFFDAEKICELLNNVKNGRGVESFAENDAESLNVVEKTKIIQKATKALVPLLVTGIAIFKAVFKKIWSHKKILFASLGGLAVLIVGIVLYANYAPKYKDGGTVLVRHLGKNVKIPKKVIEIRSEEDDSGVFSPSLETIEIPNSVKRISDRAFFGCSHITSIELPESVVLIGFSAFMGCESLEKISIPNNVKEIKKNAFLGCSSLSTITIPDSVTVVEEGIFRGCTSLETVTLPNHLIKLVYFDMNIDLSNPDVGGIKTVPLTVDYLHYLFENNPNLKTIYYDGQIYTVRQN